MTDEHSHNEPGEAQYKRWIQEVRSRGLTRLGLMTSWSWSDDPARLAFTFARYKFVAKMMTGRQKVLEVGCGDGFATRIVRQSVDIVTAIDFDPSFIDDALSRQDDDWPIDYRLHNILEGPLDEQFDGIYSLDVLEHIPLDSEHIYMKNVCRSLSDKGVVIIGMPSLESQIYASSQSKEGHVNCKTQDEFRALLLDYFGFVFMFSMNDEVLHTGFGEMAHYHLGLCCGKA